MDLISLIKELITNIVIVSWFLFILSWIIGWTIKGAPIPIGKEYIKTPIKNVS